MTTKEKKISKKWYSKGFDYGYRSGFEIGYKKGINTQYKANREHMIKNFGKDFGIRIKTKI